jgi:RNA recognition motif-containing protein
MSKKLFVGGLDWNTTDASLGQAFAGFGQVSESKVIMDRETGRSRGFGFVTFQDDSAANAAVAGMDGQMLDGRTVRVNEAQDKQGGGGGGGGGGRGGYGGGGGGGGERRGGGGGGFRGGY